MILINNRAIPGPRRVLRSRLTPTLFVVALLSYAHAQAPSPPAPAPDVITRVTAAKNIFVSNAGGNDYFNGQITGGPNASYNELYAALQQWGYFQLVDSPARADLVFQIRGVELKPQLGLAPYGRISVHQNPPQLEVTILDPKTNTAIDTITSPAGRGDNIPKGNIAFARSVEWLTYLISTRVSAPRTPSGELLSRDALRPSFESLIHFDAPVPPQVLNAKSVFLIDETAAPNLSFQNFTAALTTWGYYKLADTASSADLVLRYHDDLANGTFITLEDPASRIILWTITDPRYGFYNKGGEQLATALNQNLLSELKLLNHIPLTQAETAALK